MNTPEFGSLWPLHNFKHFEITACEKSSYIVESGSSFQINGRIRNNAEDIGTVYLIIKLAEATNQHAMILFDSDRDFTSGQKEAMRFVDIFPKTDRSFSVTIPIGHEVAKGITLDMRLELWSPGRLRYPKQPLETVALFYRSFWGDGIDIISPDDLIAKAFISYSWHSNDHIKWVNDLAQELARRQIRVVLDQKDLEFGQELTEFMEQAVHTPVCIVICSSTYTQKAYDRSKTRSGVGYEASLLANQIFKGRKRAQIIPVLRDNPSKELPDFFNSALYVDMDIENWNGKTLTDLANQIIKYNSY
jgi:TIR domain